ncbi:MAG: ubiquinol-cytochrome c reductase iron-sulfur subunit [Acidimicrobiia bacterium]|nr:ubiquinol-cytochrome c reductase iron-sulfur subunit [Acidimicrobiia bacterium]
MSDLVLLGVALVAIAAAAAAFVVGWRRTEKSDWRDGVDAETLQADRPVAVVTREAEPEPEPESEQEPEPEPEPEPVAVAVATVARSVEASPEEAGITRRRFFNRALTATFGTFSLVLGLDFLAFTWPRISGGFGSDVNAGRVQDLLAQAVNADGSVTPVFIPEARAYVVPSPAAISAQFEGKKVDAGGVMALWQRCVHLGCRVPWCQPSQGFECPCHGSKYNGIGEYFAGPAPRNLDRFVIAINDIDELIISTGSVIESPRALQPSVKYPQGPSCIGGGAA